MSVASFNSRWCVNRPGEGSTTSFQRGDPSRHGKETVRTSGAVFPVRYWPGIQTQAKLRRLRKAIWLFVVLMLASPMASTFRRMRSKSCFGNVLSEKNSSGVTPCSRPRSDGSHYSEADHPRLPNRSVLWGGVYRTAPGAGGERGPGRKEVTRGEVRRTSPSETV